MSLCENVSQGVTETVSLIALKKDSEPALGDIFLQPAKSSMRSKSDAGVCAHRHTGNMSKVSCVITGESAHWLLLTLSLWSVYGINDVRARSELQEQAFFSLCVCLCVCRARFICNMVRP